MLLSCLINSAIIALQSVKTKKKRKESSSLKTGVTRKTNVKDMRILNLQI